MKGTTATNESQVPTSMRSPEERIRQALPHLAADEAGDLGCVADTLLRTFQPERIYVFGSQVRGTPAHHSDVDLLVVVADAGEFPHHLGQRAYRVIGLHVLPLGIVFMSSEEFDWRADVVTSLPATVQREGTLLYAAAIP